MSREKVTRDGFVWISTGSELGRETGMIGYWHGEMKSDSQGIERAKVEFLVNGDFAEVLCNRSALYQPTDEEIEQELGNKSAQKWRDLL